MENKLMNQTRMIRQSSDVLGSNKSKWEGFIPFENNVTQLRNDIQIMDRHSGIILSVDNGATLLKLQYGKDMIDLSLQICGKAFAFANDNNDILLKTKTDLHKSDFVKLNDAEKASKAQSLIHLVTPIVDSLADYKVDTEVLNTWQSLVNQYKAIICLPKENIDLRAENKEGMKRVIKDAIQILKVIDKLMKHFESTEKEFYELYFKARNILNYGHGPKSTTVSIATEPNINTDLIVD